MPVVEERRRLGLRLTVLQALASTVFVLLAFSFWILQVIRHDTYEELAENNHQRTL
jgi:cell division protein FtsI/penicillin-binding protein 2